MDAPRWPITLAHLLGATACIAIIIGLATELPLLVFASLPFSLTGIIMTLRLRKRRKRNFSAALIMNSLGLLAWFVLVGGLIYALITFA